MRSRRLRWPWTPAAPSTTAEAEHELTKAQVQRWQVDRLWPRVNHISNTLAQERETNHFAERFRAALGGIE